MSATGPSPSSQTDSSTTADSNESSDVSDALEERYRDLEQTYDDTRARLEDFNDRAVDLIKENPGMCILGALAAGYVVGRLASRRWLA